jgi:hypothetical protein
MKKLVFNLLISIKLTWYENIMEGYPVFERMFYFSLGLGSFAAIISITLALSGKLFVWFVG